MIPSCGEDHHLLYSWLTTFCFEDNLDKGHWWGCTTHPLLSLKNSRHLRRKLIKDILSSFHTAVFFCNTIPLLTLWPTWYFLLEANFTSSPSPYLPADQSTVSLDATVALQGDHRIEKTKPPINSYIIWSFENIKKLRSWTTYQFTESFSPGKTSRASKNWRNLNYFLSLVW